VPRDTNSSFEPQIVKKRQRRLSGIDVWGCAIVQTCVIHLLHNTFRYASRKYWDQIAKDIRPVYTAPSEAAAKERFAEFTAKWGAQYPAIIRLWKNAWSEFVPYLDYGPHRSEWPLATRSPRSPPEIRSARRSRRSTRP
jgi:transposase-like protein